MKSNLRQHGRNSKFCDGINCVDKRIVVVLRNCPCVNLLDGRRKLATIRHLQSLHTSNTINPQVSSESTSEDTSNVATAVEPAPESRDRGATLSSMDSGDSGSSASTSSGSDILPRLRPSLLARLVACTDVVGLMVLLLKEAEERDRAELITEEEMHQIIAAALEKGNVDLAMDLYNEMCEARSVPMGSGAPAWRVPPATVATTCTTVLGLCRALRVKEALGVVEAVAKRGVRGASGVGEQIGFGVVVPSPLAPGKPLAVVAPHEGSKLVADAFSRYEYELFSGSIVTISSEALNPTDTLLTRAARSIGLLPRSPVVAVHSFSVLAPDGTSRTFRVGTTSNTVPAQVGERVTVVLSPVSCVRKPGLMSASPPGTSPGQALAVTNHATGSSINCELPPTSTAGTLPSWVLPAAALLSASDMASGMVDAALPAIIAATAVSSVAAYAATNSLLIPRLKQLPERMVRGEADRQRLLGQRDDISSKATLALREARDLVRSLAKLWQLLAKMEGVGSASAYGARIQRVDQARSVLERRLTSALEMLHGYARVMSMIEIEVEMDTELPAAEMEEIESQIARLVELEDVQREWRYQVEARDEVERLLKQSPDPLGSLP